MFMETSIRRRAAVLLSVLLVQGLFALSPSSARAQAPSPAPGSAKVSPGPAAAAPPPATPAPPAAPTPAPPPPPAPSVSLPPATAPVPASPSPPPPVSDPVVEPAAPGMVVAPEPALLPEGYYEEKDLDTIKVTVDRREKSIQSYAGSASAFTEDDLERIGVNSVRNLANATPYLEIGTQEGNTEIFIRGVGNSDNTELSDPASATYFDGVYIPRPRGVGSMFFDLERVEVNRGPQGTLRGRNATAGSINLISALPKLGAFSSEGAIQFGNLSQRLSRAMINVPVLSNLSLRLATFSENREPFYHNGGPVSTITPSENADALAYRLSALWKPSDRVTVTIRNDLSQEKGTGYTGTNFASALQAGLLPSEVPDPRAVIWRGPQPSQLMQHYGISGNLNADLGPVQLELISSYRDMRYNQTTGGNAGVAFPGAGPPDLDNWSSSYWRTTSKSTVQELRIFAPDSARLRWNAGGFYSFEKQTAFLGSTNDKGNGFAGTEFNEPNVRAHSEAGYLDATFDILKKLRATAGLRLTHENKSRNDGLAAIYLPDTGGMPFRFGTEGFHYAEDGRTIFAPTAAQKTSGATLRNGVSNFGARDTLNSLLINDNSAYTPQNGSYADNFLDWRVGIDGDLRKDSMVYLTATTGHHSGGFNDVINTPSGAAISPTYRPERLYSLEAGSKNRFLDRKATVNASVFYYLYRDQQFQGVQAVQDPGNPNITPPATLLRFNAAKSHVLGLEFEGSYKLPMGFVVGAQAMFLDARFDGGSVTDSRLGFDITSEPIVDLSGHQLPRAPHVTVNYSLGQNIPTAIGYFDWMVMAQTRSQYFMTVFNGNGKDTAGNINPVLSDVQPAYTRLDATVGYSRLDGKVRLETFATNLTDTIYLTTLINTPGLNLRFFNPPRQYGVRLQMFW